MVNMDTREAARRWRSVWQDAWPARDAAAVAALYTDDAVHRSTPFRSPHSGIGAIREYFVSSFADEVAPAEVRFAEPLIDGDRAVMEWRALVTEAAGPATIAGIAVAEFGPDGLITVSRDYWHTVPGSLGLSEDLLG